MEKVQIVYPAIAMFTLTISLLFTLGLSRYIAIRKGEVSIKYYQKYNEGSQPDRLHLLGRHVQNHFEVPPLFYAGVMFLFITDNVSLVSICAAWLYVFFRGLHTVIHLGSNNVSQRFLCFGISLISLTLIWCSLFFSLISNA